jgi:glucose/mannose-6-phosphate isomerase
VNLDDPGSYARVDTADALADVEATAEQWNRARALADVRLDLSGVDAVLVTGMGGAGIAGDVAATLSAIVPTGARRLPPVPVLVHKGYGLPAFVGPRTLVVALSHSGNTEETLSGWDAAARAGAQVFAVTAGGALAERATAAGAQLVRVPGGCQARHSLGYLAVPVLVALGLDGGLDEAIEVQTELAAAAHRKLPAQDNPAKQLALRLASGSVPLAWGARGLGALAAYRLKCQLNENAKLYALWNELPELDHNEVAGLQEPTPLAGHLGLVLLRDPLGEHPRVATRFTVTEELVHQRFAWMVEVAARGTSPLARLASLLLLVDLASVYTALELGQDPSPIAWIDRLKQALAET